MGDFLIGQIRVLPLAGGHELRHRDDTARPPELLASHDDPEEAASLALYDDDGAYRPLKTAPNLRRGWRMVLADAPSLRLALDLFYPARMRAFERFQEGQLPVTALRDTLNRQTGMYRVTGKISDEQADALVGRFCRSDGGCLRTILWKRDVAGTPPSSLLPPEKFRPSQVPGTVPLLCQEACNLLVAEARAVVKGETKA